MGGLEGLDHHSQVHQLVAQIRAAVAVSLPGPSSRRAERHRASEPQPGLAERAASPNRLALALPAADHQAATLPSAERQIGVEGALLEPFGSGEVHGDPGLLLVGEAQDVWRLVVLRQVADDLATGLEVLRDPALVVALARGRANPAGHLGDDSECPLGAQDELTQ